MKGIIRKTDDTWYFFPKDLLDLYNRLTDDIYWQSKIDLRFRKDWRQVQDDFDMLLAQFTTTFEQYRLSGGIESYIWELVE